MSFVSWGAAPIGSLLGGVLGTAFGLRPTLWISGLATLLGCAFLLFSPFRTLRRVPEREGADAHHSPTPGRQAN
jgi:predicted MFS family arabinose efflux permease